MFKSASPTPEEEASFQTAVQQSSAQRQAAKQAALEACSPQEAALLQCYREGSFFSCAAARTAFWECYRKKRVRMGAVVARGVCFVEVCRAWLLVP